jgi:hypothetical protein
MTDKGVAHARDTYAKAKVASEEAADLLENTYSTVAKGVTDWRRVPHHERERHYGGAGRGRGQEEGRLIALSKLPSWRRPWSGRLEGRENIGSIILIVGGSLNRHSPR